MSSPTTKPPKTGAESADDFLGGRLSIVQPRRGHRAGSDAVFLAAAAPARPREHVLDVGAGVGVAGLCLLARVPGAKVTAAEIHADLCALAAANAGRNGFGARFTAIEADVALPGKALSALGLQREGYHHVIANPPFYAEGCTRPAPDRRRAAAHVMRGQGLAAWLRFFAAMAAPGASLTLIHRPESLGELLDLLEGRFGGAMIFPLFPQRQAPASRIIVQARKGSRAPLSLLPGLVLHEADGRYTAEAEAVLRGGAQLVLAAQQKKGRRLGG
ncbi:MAG TPA: methyltransferase [Methyloceanibacter sp.]|nr:methyltransferase [Methyloceanibacter sp.]